MAVDPHNLHYNYGRPDFRLKYRWNDDTPFTLPLGPKNVHITSPYLIGVIDIRWDDVSSYAEHNNYTVIGVNIYKSYDSPDQSYTKINDQPVGALYYRDQTREIYVDQEDPMVGGRIIMGTNATADWVLKTYHKPIIIPGTNGKIAQHPKHVKLDIRRTSSDPFVTVPAWRVVGETGEVFLISNKVYNHTYNRIDDPILPDPDRGGEVRVSYTYIDNHIQTDINRKIYYKVTTVAEDADSNLVETPLEQCEAFSLYDMEKIDWIWAEAIRRNRWILEQGGERVKVFIRKWAGELCPCWDEQYGQAKAGCPVCYGTGYVSGYEGPYDIIIAPPETEKTIELQDIGLHVNYDWLSWTGPYPLLNDRDFVVRQNNDRFSVARVNYQGSRGAIYQQHFGLSPLDQQDPRYQVPIQGGIAAVPPSWDEDRETRPTDASPSIPNHPTIPDQYEYTGRTVTFENIVY